jgi:hypothetical protein
MPPPSRLLIPCSHSCTISVNARAHFPTSCLLGQVAPVDAPHALHTYIPTADCAEDINTRRRLRRQKPLLEINWALYTIMALGLSDLAESVRESETALAEVMPCMLRGITAYMARRRAGVFCAETEDEKRLPRHCAPSLHRCGEGGRSQVTMSNSRTPS